MREVIQHVRDIVDQLGETRAFYCYHVEFWDHKRRLEVSVRPRPVGDAVQFVAAKSDRIISNIDAVGQALDEICDKLRGLFPLQITPTEEQEQIVAILDDPNYAPKIIRKEHRTPLAGNVASAMPVFADKHGRLWREDAAKLTLVYQPLGCLPRSSDVA